MFVVKDLIGGSKPQPIELPYNGNYDEDSTTKRYKGSLVKVTDTGGITLGVFCTWADESSTMINVIGILAEEQGTSGNYLPNDADYGFRYRKIVPVFPSTIIEAEYSRKDAAGGSNTNTAATAGSSVTIDVTNTQYTMIGGWVYFLTGNNAGYLHYVIGNSGSAYTLTTGLANTLDAADTCLIIRPPMARFVSFDDTYTGIKSNAASGIDVILGLSTWISAPGIAKTKLSRAIHDGLKIDKARFYHQFTLPGTASLASAWVHGIL